MPKYLIVEEVDADEKLLKIVSEKPFDTRNGDDALREYFAGKEPPENRYAALAESHLDLGKIEFEPAKPKIKIKRTKRQKSRKK